MHENLNYVFFCKLAAIIYQNFKCYNPSFILIIKYLRQQMAKKKSANVSKGKNAKAPSSAAKLTRKKAPKPPKAAKPHANKTKTITKKKAKAKTTAKKSTPRASSRPKPAKVVAPKPATKATKAPKAAKVPKAKATPAADAEPKVPFCPKGYTAAEYTKYKQEKARLSELGNSELKQMLKKNLQSMSGNKGELVQKIADGIVLGRIPRCPNCFGGRPRYDYKTGKYTCPGYRDDVDYKNCHSVFQKADLTRDPWEA